MRSLLRRGAKVSHATRHSAIASRPYFLIVGSINRRKYKVADKNSRKGRGITGKVGALATWTIEYKRGIDGTDRDYISLIARSGGARGAENC